jgi:hypothetical protein
MSKLIVIYMYFLSAILVWKTTIDIVLARRPTVLYDLHIL